MVLSIEAGDRAGLLLRRDELVLAHVGLVPPLARAVAAGLPASFDADDLIGVGNVALLTAATRFRPEAFGGVPFTAYARPRIHGAMIDSVRRTAWVENTRPSLTDLGDFGQRCLHVEKLLAGERCAQVRAAIERLPARLRDVIHWHYDCEMGLDAVGALLDTSKTRASQLHMEAIRSLRRALAA